MNMMCYVYIHLIIDLLLLHYNGRKKTRLRKCQMTNGKGLIYSVVPKNLYLTVIALGILEYLSASPFGVTSEIEIDIL